MNGSDAAEPKKRGCLFWGCLIVGILLFFAVVAVAAVLYAVREWAVSFTDTAPMQVEQVTGVAPGELEEAKNKSESLRRAAQAGQAAAIDLTERELNVLLCGEPDSPLAGRAYFRIGGDQLSMDASIPLDSIPTMSGRYLNGRISLEVKCQNGLLEVYARSMEVNGRAVSDAFMAEFRKNNLAKDLYEDPKNIALLRRLRSVEFRNGKVRIVLAEGPPMADAQGQ